MEDSHPAIIDKDTWNRVQEELARRGGKRKVKQTDTKTEQGKYSSKFALTELLVCGDCGTPYRRVTWSRNGQKKIVWRCISRLDYGTKYCKKSPTLEEGLLRDAIVKALMELTTRYPAVLEMLKLHITAGLRDNDDCEDEYALRQRLLAIEGELSELILLETQDGNQGNYDTQFEKLYGEKVALKAKLDQIQADELRAGNAQAKLTDVVAEMNKLRHHALNLTKRNVEYAIKALKEAGLVERVGATKNGRWGVKKEN